MRFIKWPALTNALVIFTISLSSLIPAANATGPVADVNFLIPENGATYNAGDKSGITWYVSKRGTLKPSGKPRWF
jgi:hypothetical protein